MRTFAPVFLFLACLASADCAGAMAPPQTSPAPAAREALIVLPGFGYNAGGERAIRALAPAMRDAGLDLYAPRYIRRSGLEDSREELRRFLHEQRLGRYDRVHVFAFLAGGWTFNALAHDASVLPNLASVVYDRSPYQERAPRLAAENLSLLSWLRYGRVLFDVANAPYPPLPRAGVKVGLLVETVPTGFVSRFRNTARSYGPYTFACGDFAQPHDDCMFVAMDHNEIYTRFGEIWPELRAFIRDGRFTAAADRRPPQ
jgi:hypothetical protein